MKHDFLSDFFVLKRISYGVSGYFEEEKLKKISAPKHKTLEAKNYSIEDKRYE